MAAAARHPHAGARLFLPAAVGARRAWRATPFILLLSDEELRCGRGRAWGRIEAAARAVVAGARRRGRGGGRLSARLSAGLAPALRLASSRAPRTPSILQSQNVADKIEVTPTGCRLRRRGRHGAVARAARRGLRLGFAQLASSCREGQLMLRRRVRTARSGPARRVVWRQPRRSSNRWARAPLLWGGSWVRALPVGNLQEGQINLAPPRVPARVGGLLCRGTELHCTGCQAQQLRTSSLLAQRCDRRRDEFCARTVTYACQKYPEIGHTSSGSLPHPQRAEPEGTRCRWRQPVWHTRPRFAVAAAGCKVVHCHKFLP